MANALLAGSSLLLFVAMGWCSAGPVCEPLTTVITKIATQQCGAPVKVYFESDGFASMRAGAADLQPLRNVTEDQLTVGCNVMKTAVICAAGILRQHLRDCHPEVNQTATDIMFRNIIKLTDVCDRTDKLANANVMFECGLIMSMMIQDASMVQDAPANTAIACLQQHTPHFDQLKAGARDLNSVVDFLPGGRLHSQLCCALQVANDCSMQLLQQGCSATARDLFRAAGDAQSTALGCPRQPICTTISS